MAKAWDSSHNIFVTILFYMTQINRKPLPVGIHRLYHLVHEFMEQGWGKENGNIGKWEADVLPTQ